MKMYLERHGYKIRIAQSAEEGFQQLESFKPDVILLDLKLPEMNGLEALSRKRERDPQVKVVITARAWKHRDGSMQRRQELTIL
jgi:CheY-like chemotaxis protein